MFISRYGSLTSLRGAAIGVLKQKWGRRSRMRTNIAELIAYGDITIGVLRPIGCIATACDEEPENGRP